MMDVEYNPKRRYARFCNCTSLTSCRCGENNVHEWTWDKENDTYSIVLSENNLTVEFHSSHNYDVVVRGTNILEKGRHHYWEVKMLSDICGTDIIVGVGTSNMNLNSAENNFCSFLGHDKESFGFSCYGYI